MSQQGLPLWPDSPARFGPWRPPPLRGWLIAMLPVACAARSAVAEVVTIPPLGTVTVERQPETRRDSVFIVRRAGIELLRLRFDTKDGVFVHLRYRVIRVPGVDETAMVVTAESVHGSDSDFETAVLAVRGGTLAEIVSPRLRGNLQDGACWGLFGSPVRARLLLANRLWDEPGHALPVRFHVTTYDSQQGVFRRSLRVTTRARHDWWQAALRERGIRCEHDLTVRPPE